MIARRLVRATTAIAVTGVLTCMAHATLPEPALPPVLQALSEGEWVETGAGLSDDCGNAASRVRYLVTDQGLRLRRAAVHPALADDSGRSDVRYRILVGDDKRVLLYREGETFALPPHGDPPIRQLVLTAPDRYRFRLLGQPLDAFTALQGQRCH